jgi:hypothetical protein
MGDGHSAEQQQALRSVRQLAALGHRCKRSTVDFAHRFTRRTPARHAGWVPFILILTAIVVLAGAGITWVTSPYWHRQITTAAPRDVGIVPVKAGATVAYLSPYRIEIPRLDAVAPIVDVSTLPGGELDVPLNPKVVGWWKYGAKPGAAKGTAILDGHINFAGVDGVLARIGTLDPGDTVYIYGITAGKNTRLPFKITGVRTYSKQALPYKEIFDQKSVGRLAIVTCGGPFDASTGNYRDNIVAFAVPV